MNENLKHTIVLAILAVVFFIFLTDTFFPYIMIIIKTIFFICGIICGLGSVGCFSQILNKKN